MSAAERAAMLHSLGLHDAIAPAVDERTLEILERRRRTAVVRRRGWLVRRMLLAADLVGLVAAAALAELVVPSGGEGSVTRQTELLIFILTLPAWIVVAKLYGLYNRDEERTDHSTPDDFAGVFHMLTVGAWLLWASSYLTRLADPDPWKLVLFWIAAITLVPLARAGARGLARRSVIYLQNAVIVGAGDVGQLIARKLLQHPEYGINLVGFVDHDPVDPPSDLGHLPFLGAVERVPALVRLFDVERVIVAFPRLRYEDTLSLVQTLRGLDVQVDIVPRLYETVGPNVGIDTVEGIPVLGLPPLRSSPSTLLLKRSLDVAVAAVSLLLLLPVLGCIALGVKLSSCGPVLYRDERIGRRGRIFRALKFRTMRIDAHRRLDELLADPALELEFRRTHKLRRDPRVTAFGRLLRRTSLDELPQFMNVLKGDVSLVGPRPITRYEFEQCCCADAPPPPHMSGYWMSDLRPGLTGYWQINGRSGTSYEDRVRLDMAYATSWSLGLDLRILAKTLRVLVARTGAY